jgi:protein TonB
MKQRFLIGNAIARLALAGGLAVMYLHSPLAADDSKRVATGEAMRAAVSKPSPEYPPIAKQMHLSGDVNMDVTINEDGSVDSVSVLQGNPILAKPASDAVKRWKFTPFKFDGKPAKVVAAINVNFAL